MAKVDKDLPSQASLALDIGWHSLAASARMWATQLETGVDPLQVAAQIRAIVGSRP